jgi:two-component system chemotaxis sensor kinase CheA
MVSNQLAVLNQDSEVNNNAQALIVGVKSEVVAIPLSSVLAIENVQAADVRLVDREDVIDCRGQVIPLIYLDKVFELEEKGEDKAAINVVVCAKDNSNVGIVVDKLFGQAEIESKSLGILSDNEFFTGVSLLPDADDVALILNLDSLVA